MSRITLVLGCILVSCVPLLASGQGTTYTILLKDTRIFTPCEKFPDNFIPSLINIDDVEFEFLDDDNVHVKGQLLLLKDIPGEVKFEAQTFKKSRGSWVSTVYNMRRDNFCDSLFDPDEMWYKFSKTIPEKYQKCPLKKDVTVDVDDVSELTFTVPDRNADGEYKTEAKITYGDDPSDFVCFEVLFSAEK